jgi:hypothetical protein
MAHFIMFLSRKRKADEQPSLSTLTVPLPQPSYIQPSSQTPSEKAFSDSPYSKASPSTLTILPPSCYESEPLYHHPRILPFPPSSSFSTSFETCPSIIHAQKPLAVKFRSRRQCYVPDRSNSKDAIQECGLEFMRGGSVPRRTLRHHLQSVQRHQFHYSITLQTSPHSPTTT